MRGSMVTVCVHLMSSRLSDDMTDTPTESTLDRNVLLPSQNIPP